MTGARTQVAVSPRTRPLASSLTVNTATLWIIVVVWPFAFADYQVYTASAAIPLAVAALGLLVLQGWSREISLASAGLFGTAVYFFGYLVRQDNLGQGIPWVLAAVIAVGAVTAVMVVMAAASVRLPGIYLVVITLGVQITLEKSVFTVGRLSGGISGGTELGIPISNPRPWFFGLPLQSEQAFYWFLLGWLIVIVLLLVRLRHSPAGRAFLLVGTDRQAAAAVGISPLRYRLAAFAVSGVLAGTAGVLACWLYINPPVFYEYIAPASLLLLAIPVLAGRGSIGWVLAIAAAYKLGGLWLEQFHINSFLLAGLGLIGGALAGPRGLGGLSLDLRRRLRRRDRERQQPVGGDEASNPDLAPSDVLTDWFGPSTEGSGPALQVADIDVQIDGLAVLDRVSLAVPEGSFCGLIGPNGAGKSTLFDVVSGFRPPDCGTVQLFGEDVTGAAAWRRPRAGMSRVFQSTQVIEDLTVADNLMLGAHHHLGAPTLAYLSGWREAWDASAVAERAARAVATMLAINDRWDDRAGTLSFSGRRRIEIGRALLASPRVLLLDEPAAGLDPNSSAAMFDLLRRLHVDLGMTVVLVEHNVTAVLSTCDLVHVLTAGKVLASGTPAEITANETVRTNYLGNRLRFSAATSH